MICIFIFILAAITNAKIAVNVTVHWNKSNINITFKGNDYKIITNKELHVFNVTTEKLNEGLDVELGKVPNDIFLKDPTKYGNLYEKYHWEPVKRSLKVNKAKIVDIIKEDIALKAHEYVNNSTTALKYQRNMYEIVENTAHSSWFMDGIPDDDIYYNMTFNFGYGSLKYENKWRNNSQHRSKLSIGETKKGNILIQPLQTVLTKLIVTKTILLIELEYKAHLIGATVVNYAELYGKYHFWAPSVQSIMKAAKMKNEILTRELIEVRCFLNPRLDVRDKVTGEIVEPPKKKLPRFRILRKKKINRIIYTKIKKPPKQQKKNKYL